METQNNMKTENTLKTFTTLLMILAVITALAGVIIGIYFIADDESAIGFGFIAGSLLSFLMLFIKAYTAEVICNISEKLNSTKVEEPRTTTQHNTTQHNTTQHPTVTTQNEDVKVATQISIDVIRIDFKDGLYGVIRVYPRYESCSVFTKEGFDLLYNNQEAAINALHEYLRSGEELQTQLYEKRPADTARYISTGEGIAL